MKADKRIRRRRIRGEKGYILIMTGLLLVPLIVFTAFGVDLGAWYAQSSREQRAVDAASLAGVVQMPSTTNAAAAALAALKANGYNPTGGCASNTTTVSSASGHQCAFAYPTAEGLEMTVTLYAAAPQYFSSIVLNGESLTRQATAIYNTHIPLGSPSNSFGNNGPPAAGQPQIYGAINGPYMDYDDGDPYSTHCAGSPSDKTADACDSSGANTLYHANGAGYEWGIQVPSSLIGQTVTVQLYDASYWDQYTTGTLTMQTNASGTTTVATCNGNGSNPKSGPANPCINPLGDSFGGSGANTGFTTGYQMYNYSPSNAVLDTSAGNTITSCGDSTTGAASVAPYDRTNSAAWTSLCEFTVPSFVGSQIIYPMMVTAPGTGAGTNQYSIRACVGKKTAVSCAATTEPTVYGIDSLSVYTPGANGGAGSNTSSFYLASIGPQYEGKTLEIKLFDPGDGSGSTQFTLSVLQPPSGTPANPPTGTPAKNSVACTYTSPSDSKAAGVNFGVPDTPTSSCDIITKTTTQSNYNGLWLVIDVVIPTAGQTTCNTTTATDCWWGIYYNFGVGGASTDRTVWQVDVKGDPVHLIE